MSICELMGRPYRKSDRPYPVYDALKVNEPTGLGGVKNANVVVIQLKPNFSSCLPCTQLSAWSISHRLLTFSRLPLPSPKDAIPEMLTVVMPGPPRLALGIPSCSAIFPSLVSSTMMSSTRREKPARNS